MILAIAGLFLALHAQFLAAIQLIVYAGAIVVLFLFVIMLLGPSATSPRDHRGRFTRTFGGAALRARRRRPRCYLVIRARVEPRRSAAGRSRRLRQRSTRFGRSLFTDGLVPFELSSALLMVAIVGAVAVARGKHQSDRTAAPKTEAA